MEAGVPRRGGSGAGPRGETRSEASGEPAQAGGPQPSPAQPQPPASASRSLPTAGDTRPWRASFQVRGTGCGGFSVCCCLVVGLGLGSFFQFFLFWFGFGWGKCELVFMRSFMTPDKLIFEDDTELCSLRNWGGDVFSDTRLLRDWGKKKKAFDS